LLENASLDEAVEPVRQEIRRDSGEAMKELVIPPRPLKELPHDEKDPAIADDVQAPREAAVLVV
jgi:hypothetical protein